MVTKSNGVTITVDKEGFPELVEELRKVFDSETKPILIDLSGGKRHISDLKTPTYLLTLTINY